MSLTNNSTQNRIQNAFHTANGSVEHQTLTVILLKLGPMTDVILLKITNAILIPQDKIQNW